MFELWAVLSAVFEASRIKIMRIHTLKEVDICFMFSSSTVNGI